MKFKIYLNEMTETEQDLIEYAKDVERDCSEIIKFYKQAGKFLYRGMRSVTVPFQLRTPRADRAPRDTDPIIHKALDKLFKEKFNWNVRSEGLFCMQNKDAAMYYGNSYVIYPFNNFKYVWSSKNRDLTATLNMMGINRPKITKHILTVLKDVVASYIDTDIVHALNSINEIAIKTDKYYAVSALFDYEISDIRTPAEIVWNAIK